MANRAAFIDFAQGLLNLNPLERWTPAQAKMHPFITQAKYTGPFVPPTTLKSGSSRSPAPGVQEQQRFEGISRQRLQAQQQAVAAQQAQAAQNAAFANMQMNQYAAPSPQGQPAMYNNMYSPNHQGAPPPYPAQAGQYGQQPMGMMQPQQPRQYAQPQNLYAQATTRAGRQRASTMDQQQPGAQPQSGIPPALQRVISHLDPNAPIRLQPSPAYYPPPPDGAPESAGSARRRGSRAGNAGRNQNFVRNLEDRTLEEGFMNQTHWQ